MFLWDQRMTLFSFQTLFTRCPDMTYTYNKPSEIDLWPLWGCFGAGTSHSRSEAAFTKPLSGWPFIQSVNRASSAPNQLPTPCWLSLGFLMTGSSRPSIFWSERLGGKPTELGRIPRWFWSQNCAKHPPCLLIQRLEFLVSHSSAETCHSILLQKPCFNRMKSIFYNSQIISEIYNILCFFLKTG